MLTALAAFLMVLGIGLKQMRLIRGHTLARAVPAAFISFVLAGLTVAAVFALGGGHLTERFELQSAMLIAFTVTAITASDLGRARIAAIVIFIVALAGALAAAQLGIDWSTSLTFIAGGAAGLGSLFVVGARPQGTRDYSASGRLAAVAGMLAVLVGWSLVWIAATIPPLFALRALAPAAGAGFIVAATISFVLGRRGLSRNLDQGLLGALAGMLAISSTLYLDWDPVMAGAAAGVSSAVLAGAFARLKLDDAAGFDAALIACGVVRLVLPEVLAGTSDAIPDLAWRIGAVAIGGLGFGFLLALLLQITIGLRVPTENSEAAAANS